MIMDDPYNEKRTFRAFLEIYPEYKSAMRDMATSIHQEIVRMGLPRNKDCLDIVRRAMQMDESNDDDTYAAFKELTFFDRSNSNLSPGQCRAFLTEKASALPEMKLSESLVRALATDEIDRIRKLSQGLGNQTRTKLMDFIAINHLETIAEICREAAAYGMLDEECINLESLAKEFRAEGLPDPDPERRYDHMITGMGQVLAEEMAEAVESLFKTEPPKRRPPLTRPG